jgi:hypothetical protein
MEESKFVLFGCWNSRLCGDNDNSVSIVTRALRDYAPSHGVQYLIVAGDNYYPIKNKKIKDDVKRKVINKTLLESGFRCLPEMPTYLLWGNHDLDNSDKLLVYNREPTLPNEPFDETIINISDPTLLDAQAKPCTILDLELDYVRTKPNIIIPGNNLVLTKYDEGTNTFIIMLDTTMYEIGKKDKNRVTECYRKFLGIPGIDLQGVKNIQEAEITRIITDMIIPNERIENLIIVGHHPLFSVKRKEEKDGGKDIIDGMPGIYGVLYNKINLPLRNAQKYLKYFYLCADLHSYQMGTLYIKPGPGQGSGDMVITQYISGTGGTKLDPMLQHNGLRTEFFTDDEGKVLAVYKMETNRKTHGFLECSIKRAGPPLFKFIPVATPESMPSAGGARRRKRRNSTKKRKNSKRSRKNRLTRKVKQRKYRTNY